MRNGTTKRTPKTFDRVDRTTSKIEEKNVATDMVWNNIASAPNSQCGQWTKIGRHGFIDTVFR